MTTADLAGRTSDEKRLDQPTPAPERDREPLFADHEANDFRSQWQRIQGAFVDDPRTAVQDADELVASAIRRLAEVFADERAKLEQSWSSGGEADTEALRQALRRYRSFFDRLLSV